MKKQESCLGIKLQLPSGVFNVGFSTICKGKVRSRNNKIHFSEIIFIRDASTSLVRFWSEQ